MLKIASIVGARPQFIKVAPVSKAISKYPKIKEIIIHTGQHYDYGMSGIFFKKLGLKQPDYNLNVGSASHGKQTGLMLERIEKVLKKEKPDLVMVYGDTNSTLAGALAAKKMNIPLAHVEAGLRCYNMLVPEELNRLVTDRISDILFCPSRVSSNNLSREGIINSHKGKFPRVFLSGDVMYDSILYYSRIAQKNSKILSRLSLVQKRYYLATVHRQENTDHKDRLKTVLGILNEIARDNLPVVFPVHPRTRKAIASVKMKPFVGTFRLIEPVSYLESLILQKNALAILTDSGGMQKEACFLGVPCITLRKETEWVETVECGANVLAGTDKKKILAALRGLGSRKIRHPRIYGDGRAAENIAKTIIRVMRDG